MVFGGIMGFDVKTDGRVTAAIAAGARSPAARSRAATAGIGAVCIAALALPAAAQTADRTSVDERVRQAVPLDQPGIDTGTAAGSPLGSLLLLRERDFFTFAVNGGASYTSNALLRDKDRDDDVQFNFDASLRAATMIAERFEVFAEVAGYALRYADNEELNLNGVRGRIGASTKVKGFDIGFTYSPTIAWDDDFDDHLVTLHPLALTVSRAFMLGREFALVPVLSGGYTFADPSEFAAANATASVTVAWLPRQDLSVFLTPNASYRHYTDYFESITDDTREDVNVGVVAGLNYIPFQNALLQLTFGISMNDSTIQPLDYEVFNAGPSVRFSMRF